MTTFNTVIKKRNSTNDGWDSILPITTAENVLINEEGDTVATHLAKSTQQAHLAKNIGLEDTEGNFTATELEGAMNELFTNVSNGKTLVGGAIADVDESVVIPTDPTFEDLASAIGGISIGKKWASGTYSVASNNQSVSMSGLDFRPSILILRSNWTTSPTNIVSAFWATTLLGAERDLAIRVSNTGAITALNYDVYDDGFRIQASIAGTYLWVAIE